MRILSEINQPLLVTNKFKKSKVFWSFGKTLIYYVWYRALQRLTVVLLPTAVRRQQIYSGLFASYLCTRDRPRFFDQVWHQTTSASIGNKHFFTKLWPRQTYQNYEQPCQRSQNSEFQSHFSVSKIGRIFRIFSVKKYLIRRPTYFNELWFLKYFIY